MPGDGDGAEVVGQRQVAVGDDDVVEALAGDGRPTGVDGAVEAEARAPQHLGAGAVGPRRHVVVVAGDERRQRPGGDDDAVGQPAGQLGPLGAVEQPDRRPLAALNRFTGMRTASPMLVLGTAPTLRGARSGRADERPIAVVRPAP